MQKAVLHLVSNISYHTGKSETRKVKLEIPIWGSCEYSIECAEGIGKTSHGCSVAGAAVNVWPQLCMKNGWSRGDPSLCNLHLGVINWPGHPPATVPTLGFSFSVLFNVPSPFSGIYIGPIVGFGEDAGSGFFPILVDFVTFILASRFLLRSIWG